MSAVFRMKLRCAVCGKENEYSVLGSTNAFGSPDLDLRPPEMERSTMYLWVMECPDCGYVSDSVEDETSIDPDFLKSPKYLLCDGIRFRDPLAGLFYKDHLISLQEGDTRGAFYALLHAAWACDDKRDRKQAVKCRSLSLPFLTELIENGGDDKNGLQVMRADIMRRAGCFDELLKEYTSVSLGDELLDKLLAFEQALAEKRDTACHTVREATEPDTP